MSVVGIDFGAKTALIAAAGRGGVDVILNGNSNRQNPCMVGFDDCRYVGEAASSKASSNYRNTVFNMKRLIGLSFEDPRAQAEMKRVPFSCVPLKHASGGPDSIGVKVTLNSEESIVPIEAVAGMMVKHMGSIAAAKAAASADLSEADKANLKGSLSDVSSPLFPRDWVIAVPGYYTDSQKRAFLAGCENVGVTGVLRLIHETTATALAYGIFKDIKKVFTKENPTNVMFIDMGETSYSVSIVEFVPGKLIVKSSHYDPDLGGRDFDLLIAEWLAAEFEAKYKGKLSAKPMEKPKVCLKLLTAAEKAKKTLSPTGVKESRINLECLMDDLDFGISLRSENYEKMCEPLLARLAPPIMRALDEAKLKASDLASVEIVGGSTRIGSVKRTLAKILGLNEKATNCGLSTTMNADEAVCRGAALQSAILSPRFKVLPYEIVEYQPYPVKIAWDGEAAEGEGVEVEGEAEGSDLPSNSVIMFDRGSNFPVVRRVTLRRSGEFIVTASYDESAAQYNYPKGASKEIAMFKIQAPKEIENKIRVNVKQDVHGTILLSSAQMVEEIVEDEEMPATPQEGEEKAAGEDAKKEETKGEETKAPKKKIKKTNLQFAEARPLEWTKEEMEKTYEKEVSMSNVDRIVRETADMRNELESYIYDMRDKIISESYLAPFCSEEEKSAFSSLLESSENWLYEEGFDATKSVYAEKLNELKKTGDPITIRQREAAARPNAISVLQRSIEKYKNWLNMSQGDEKYDHITDEERQMCDKKCDEVSNWMYEMMDKQGALPPTANPVVLVSEINAKSQELSGAVSPIMHKPKPKPTPKPKAEEEKKPEDGKAAEEKTEAEQSANGTPEGQKETEPMDTSDDKGAGSAEPMDTA